MSGLVLSKGYGTKIRETNGKHRYWRIKVTSKPSTYAQCGSMMIVRNERGQQVDMTSIPWISSPYEASYPPSNMFTTNPWTFQQWGNQSVSNMYIRWDFGAAGQDIGSVAFAHTHAFTNRNVNGWNFQWSDNDSDWTTVYTASGLTYSRGYGRRFVFLKSYHPSIMRFWRIASWHPSTSYPRIGSEWEWKIGSVVMNGPSTVHYGQADENGGVSYGKDRLSNGNLNDIHQYEVNYNGNPNEGGLDFGCHMPIDELWLRATSTDGASYAARCPSSMWIEWSEDECMWNRVAYDNSGTQGSGQERTLTWSPAWYPRVVNYGEITVVSDVTAFTVVVLRELTASATATALTSDAVWEAPKRLYPNIVTDTATTTITLSKVIQLTASVTVGTETSTFPISPPYAQIENTMVDYFQVEGVDDAFTMTMQGAGAPRALVKGDHTVMTNIAVKAKVEAISMPTDEWVGFSAMVIGTTGTHNFVGMHRRADSTWRSHALGFTWDVNSGSGWSSTYATAPYQAAPFWIACTWVGTTLSFYTSPDNVTWTLSRTLVRSVGTLLHFGLGIHTLYAIEAEDVMQVEFSNVTWDDITGLP